MIPLTLGLGSSLTFGYAPGPTVTDAYAAPFRFTGSLAKVTVELE